jgi:eukaryotic-like serine/threonine-protein kinase
MSNTVLGERYELHEKLGSGGMSNVYRATDRILERSVAVKVLAEHLSDDDRFVARFRREALAVAKLIHPNIVQVYDTGVDSGRHFIVMELVEGRSGAQILKSDGVLDPETTVEIGVQACAGLEYAHRHGIIHRDVKPGNLMIIGGDRPGGMTCKLTDFGIARLAEQTRITHVGLVVGTAAYLAPEQVRGEEATPATDVYALGVVLYQFLTGRLPYEGSSLAELAVRQQNEKPLPPITYNSDVPETVSASVMRALEGNNEIRFQTAGAFSDGLERGLRGEDVTLPLEDDESRDPATFPMAETATRPLERTARTAHRPAPAPARYTPPPRPVVKKRSFMGKVGRFLIGLIVMVMIAAVVAGAVIALTDRAASVKVREWAGQSVDDLSNELKQTLRDNTQ